MGSKRKTKRQQALSKVYQCKTQPLIGNRFVGILPQARSVFRVLQKQTKRRPYIRSLYFQKEKVFFDFFWHHLEQKSIVDRVRRLKYLPCALELLRKSRLNPQIFIDSNQKQIIKYRFIGMASESTYFAVIIQENLKKRNKQLISIYPLKKIE